MSSHTTSSQPGQPCGSNTQDWTQWPVYYPGYGWYYPPTATPTASATATNSGVDHPASSQQQTVTSGQSTSYPSSGSSAVPPDSQPDRSDLDAAQDHSYREGLAQTLGDNTVSVRGSDAIVWQTHTEEAPGLARIPDFDDAVAGPQTYSPAQFPSDMQGMFTDETRKYVRLVSDEHKRKDGPLGGCYRASSPPK